MHHTYRGLRIAVVGTSGTSEMSSILSNHLGIPHVQLDREATSSSEQSRSVLSDVTRQNAWIVDASSPVARDIVWPHANIIVWLDYAKHAVTGRGIMRFLHSLVREGRSALYLLRALAGSQRPGVDYTAMMDTRWVRLTTLSDTRSWMCNLTR